MVYNCLQIKMQNYTEGNHKNPGTDNNRDSNQDKLCYRDLKGLDFDPKLNPTGLENRLLNNSTAMVDILLE